MRRLRENWKKRDWPSAAWMSLVARLLNGVRSLSPYLMFEWDTGEDGIVTDLDADALFADYYTGEVRVNDGDDMAYLDEQFADHEVPETFDNITDLAVSTETVSQADPADELIRIFLKTPAGAGLKIDSAKLAVDIAGQTEHTTGSPSAMYLLLWNGSEFRKITVANLLGLLGTLSASATNVTLGKDASGTVGWESPGAFSCE